VTAPGPAATSERATPAPTTSTPSGPLRFLVASGVAAAVLGGLAIAAWWPRDGGATSAASVPDGSQLFRVKGCIACHDGPDGSASVPVGPPLTGLRARLEARSPADDAEDYVRRSVRDPQAFVVPGFEGEFTRMPVLPVDDAELDALVAYLLEPDP
jgi:mono/diheme cytochrome c family protein